MFFVLSFRKVVIVFICLGAMGSPVVGWARPVPSTTNEETKVKKTYKPYNAEIYRQFASAINSESIDNVIQILNQGADPNYAYELNKGEITPLCRAIRKKNLPLVKVLIENGASIKNQHYTNDPLTECSGEYNVQVREIFNRLDPVVLALDLKAFDILDYLMSVTPYPVKDGLLFPAALYEGNDEFALKLLKMGADPEKNNPLYYAVLKKNKKTLAALLEKGANPNLALFAAAANGDLETAQILLKKYADPNFTLIYDEGPTKSLAPETETLWKNEITTPLKMAIYRQNEKMVRLFLDGGAYPNVDAADEQKVSPLAVAAQGGDTSILQLLIDRGANPNTFNNKPLMNALLAKKEEAALLLLKNGASIDYELDKYYSGPTSLGLAAQFGHEPLFNLLLEKGAKVDDGDYSRPSNGICEPFCGPTPLIEAAYFGNIEILKLLIDHQADVNKQDYVTLNFATNAPVSYYQHRSALHWAVAQGRVEIAAYLLDHDAKADLPDYYGNTPLILATRLPLETFKEMAKLLAPKGNVKAQNIGGISALHAVFLDPKEETTAAEKAQILLEMGADVNAKTANQSTPLMYASGLARHEFPKAASVLIKTGHAKLDEENKVSMTAVKIAAENGFSDVVQILCGAGATGSPCESSGSRLSPLHPTEKK